MTSMNNMALFIPVLGILLLESLLLASFVIPPHVVVVQNRASSLTQTNPQPLSILPSPRNEKGVYLDKLQNVKSNLISRNASFLEINFSKEKAIRYEEGKMINEVPILAKGDPQGWGGTPAGLYAILTKHKVAFSGISQVYMPYAIKFYGKYYLHGEPYYAGGKKLSSDVSGGCIRLKDGDAEVLYNGVDEHLPVLVIDKENDGYVYNFSSMQDPPQISAQGYLIADLDSGFVFAEKNSQMALPIASLTKLMTALILAENVDLRKSVEITPHILQAYGENPVLKAGEKLRVVELLYPLLISSSNDAAEALGEFLGRENTIRFMNEKADAMFMEDASFADLSGLHEDNVATPQDLFFLGRYLLNNRPPILEITKGKEVLSFGPLHFAKEDLWNKNIFHGDPSFLGGKTGYTNLSKHTALFLFRFLTQDAQSRNVAFILLGSEDIEAEVQKLYQWLTKSYAIRPDYTRQPLEQ